MRSATLVLPEKIASDLRFAAAHSLETAAVLLVSVTENPGEGLRLLGREVHWVPDHAYVRRESDGLTVASEGYIHALGRAAEIGASAIWFHTHPGVGASPRPSRNDKIVDNELADLFRLRAESDYYGALIVAEPFAGPRIEFTGHINSEIEQRVIDRIWVVGDRLQMLTAYDASPSATIPAMFDRNVRAFGGDIQRVLGDLKVAVVGCGGTGSAVAEQLIRLGVRRLLLIDPDVLSESNVTRVYGSTPGDVGQTKVRVLASHLQRIAPDAAITAVVSTITVEATARLVAGCDTAFGCTDDNAGRLVLSRLATYYLLPAIDCGILLSSDAAERLTGIDGRVTVMTPGSACLVCRNRIDLARAATESLTPGERRRRQDEGYAPALPGIEPAVVAYTSLIAATAVGEMLERLVGYGPDPVPSEVLVRIHEREISTNIGRPQSGHYCDPTSEKLGRGETTPFLEQMWTA